MVRRRKNTAKRMNNRVKKLQGRFAFYANYLDSNNIFSGPSVYFHKKAIEFIRDNGLEAALGDNSFFEYLYATLASWGLHRMGKTKTKLVDFEEFKGSIKRQKDQLLELKGKRISNMKNKASREEITIKLAELINSLKVGRGETKLIYNSKTLHHLLPNLMPPIDTQYTLQFFYYRKRPSHIDNRFQEIYPKFVEIAVSNKKYIRRKVEKCWRTGVGFHTSETKVIDNAIVGFIKTQP